MIEFLWPSLACLILAGGLVLAEMTERSRLQSMLKPVAALMFILQAMILGAGHDPYGALILFALCLSAVGDVFLLARGRPLVFKLGMLAFGLAHIAYAAAFAIAGPVADEPLRLLAAPAAAVLILGSMAWLLPKLQKGDRVAVGIYSFLIGSMLVGAWLTAGAALPWWIGIAALLFAVSDLFVARDRFLERDPRNDLVITPLYFGAQCLFAISVL